MKILVVDDETMVLRFLKHMISNIDASIEVNTAIDGEKALERIEESMPDIMITDIRMPVMDGMALIDQIQKKYGNRIICIIMSAYSDFEYMRKAITMIVDDYLLKPVSEEELTSLLDKLKLKIIQKHKEIQQQTIKDMMSGSIDLYNLDNLSHKNMILMFYQGNYCYLEEKQHQIYSDTGDFQIIQNIYKQIQQLGCNAMLFYGQIPNEMIMIIEDRDQWDQNIMDLLSQSIENSEIPISVLVSEIEQKVAGIASKIGKMRVYMEKNLVYCQSTLLYFDESYDRNILISLLYTTSIISEIIDSICIQNRSQLWDTLEQITMEMKKNKMTQFQIKLFLSNLAMQIRSIGLIQDSDYYDFLSSLFCVLSDSDSYSDFADALTEVLYSLANTSENDQKSKISRQQLLCLQVEQYILKNYNKPLTIQMLSEQFHIAGGYLSSIFKKYKKESIVEYITALRIEKAKELILTHPDMLLKEIAQEVGYIDQLYFSRIFKKNTGFSPSQFIKKQG